MRSMCMHYLHLCLLWHVLLPLLMHPKHKSSPCNQTLTGTSCLSILCPCISFCSRPTCRVLPHRHASQRRNGVPGPASLTLRRRLCFAERLPQPPATDQPDSTQVFPTPPDSETHSTHASDRARAAGAAGLLPDGIHATGPPLACRTKNRASGSRAHVSFPRDFCNGISIHSHSVQKHGIRVAAT